MDDLVQFLSDRLDEDEQISRKAGSRQPRGDQWEFADMHVRAGDGAPVTRHTWVDEGAHIARHDPSRVLAQVDIDRELLGEYERVSRAYAAHRQEADRLTESAADDTVRRNAHRREADYLPAMLHILERWAKRKAAVHDGHPDYNEAWRP
ncbi:hypothetical protein OV320_2578 [Actinobacteria bacterium OV320]|nr:hypothetical protein OV320_2578 [Actinobacteria bacterium OV320]